MRSDTGGPSGSSEWPLLAVHEETDPQSYTREELQSANSPNELGSTSSPKPSLATTFTAAL